MHLRDPTALPSSLALENCQHGKLGKLFTYEVTPTLEHISRHPFESLSITSENFESLEGFTITHYDKSSPLESVNESRMILFSKRKGDLDNILSTQVNCIMITIVLSDMFVIKCHTLVG